MFQHHIKTTSMHKHLLIKIQNLNIHHFGSYQVLDVTEKFPYVFILSPCITHPRVHPHSNSTITSYVRGKRETEEKRRYPAVIRPLLYGVIGPYPLPM